MWSRQRVCILVAGLVACFGARALETTRYVLLTGDGRPGGEQVVERADGGLTTVRYIFKNNGRGPELDEFLRVAPDGQVTEYRVRGVSEMGAPVDEEFVRDGGRAAWRSNADRGEAALSGPAVYMPLNGSFEMSSVALGALAGRDEAELPLLPSGRLGLRTVDRLDLGGGRQVRLVAMTGLGLSPAFFWATEAPRPRLFAALFPGWMTAIEDGWQGSAGLLAERQRSAEVRLLAQIATRLRQPLRGLTVVRNARVFDSESARLGGPVDIYLHRGRIGAVLPAGTPGPGADQQIDAGGRVALPGLFDMHAHVDRWDGALHLAAGVTTVRDLGNDNGKLQQMLDEIDAGGLLSPQIVPSGFLEGESPHSSRLGFVARTLQQAHDAVDWYAARGYLQLKIYNSFPREWVPEITAHAHARGMRVSGHVPVFMRAQEVVEQGFDEIQHINQVLLNFLVTPQTDTRTLERFYLPARELADLDLDAAPVQDFLALLARRGTVIDPTLATFAFFQQRAGEMSAPYAAVAPHLPPDVQRGLRFGGMDIPDDETAMRYRASFAKMVEFVGRLHRAGIPLVAGTDGIAGFTLHSELELYVQAGLSPAQALQVATRNGALYTRTSGDRGRIAAGQRADIVLFDGNPVADIADLRKVALVITQGGVVTPSEVYRELGIAPFVVDPPKLQPAAAGAR